ncbi:MAG: adenosylcobinamide-phosphate synthase CbiB [Coriobacteriia bacterium]|nr:adenosylcobinamide-phosphate synthase CbiB [Coriobacteriia bacterium]
MAAFKTALIIPLAFLLDWVIGDPQNPFHPMRLIGKGIAAGTKAFKKAQQKQPWAPALQFVGGALLTVVTVGLAFAVTAVVIWALYLANFWLGLLVEAVICYFLIAAHSLKKESQAVYRTLTEGSLEQARHQLSMIVGRDTESLSGPAIVRATVETVAENVSDGVIAPLIYIAIGGAPLGMAYKAVNTLDSMIGYRNADYEYFGKFAARLDDVVNFIPARFSALLMILASAFVGADSKGARRVFARDRYKHKSINSAQTESVCAGALGLCLGGDSYYHGQLVSKPTIGDGDPEPGPEQILAANRLMYATAVIAVVVLVALIVAAALAWRSFHV